MKRGLIFLVLLAACAGTFVVLIRFPVNVPSSTSNTKTIFLHEKPLVLEIVADAKSQTQGLSDRPSMPIDHGMLFVFDHPDRYSFWMNRMHFPIDIIWLRDGKIVDMTTLPAPKSGEQPASYTPREPVNQVLELNAGQAQAYGLRLGEVVIPLTGRSFFDK